MSQGKTALFGLCASSLNWRKKSGAPVRKRMSAFRLTVGSGFSWKQAICASAPVAFELSQTNRRKPGAPVRQSLIYKGTGATGAARRELEQAKAKDILYLDALRRCVCLFRRDDTS
jgi:hypothetical protein